MNTTQDFLLRAVIMLIAYLSPMGEIFAVMLLFVSVDLITGVLASRTKKIPRSSRRARKSVIKLLCYLAAVILTYSAERAFDIDWFVAHKFIGAFICMIEFISILENLAVISNKPIFLKIIKLIRGKASSENDIIKEILNEKNDNNCDCYLSSDSVLSDKENNNNSRDSEG